MAPVTKYAIEKIDTGERVRYFSTMPGSFRLTIDGRERRVVSPVAVGDEGLGYRFIQIDEVDFARPGTYYTQGADTETREGAVVTITRLWTAWTQEEIDAYEAARLDSIANEVDELENVTRAAVLVIRDEFNRYSDAVQGLKDAILNGSNLADIKQRMSAVSVPPKRTLSELKTAIRNNLAQADT